jgi:hypothetical protein
MLFGLHFRLLTNIYYTEKGTMHYYHCSNPNSTGTEERRRKRKEGRRQGEQQGRERGGEQMKANGSGRKQTKAKRREEKQVEAGRSEWELGGMKKSGREQRGAKGSSIHAQLIIVARLQSTHLQLNCFAWNDTKQSIKMSEIGHFCSGSPAEPCPTVSHGFEWFGATLLLTGGELVGKWQIRGQISLLCCVTASPFKNNTWHHKFGFVWLSHTPMKCAQKMVQNSDTHIVYK